MKVLFVNDKAQYNMRYRSHLIQYFVQKGYQVETIGMFEYRFFLNLIRISLGRNTLVSSNLKANLICLLVFYSKGLVILNGLGRLRRNRKLRILILALFAINKSKVICVQNFADFRYFRRFADSRLRFVLGSGGECRTIAAQGLMVVSRANKLRVVADDIRLVSKIFGLQVAVAGTSQDEVASAGLDDCCLGMGYLPQRDLLSIGALFVQPRGYGEGFPHSLADAIVSGCKILIHEKSCVEFGIWDALKNSKKLSYGWIMFTPDKKLVESVTHSTVSEKYFESYLAALND